MLKGIAWQGLGGKTPFNNYTGPSWSWARYNGISALGSFDHGWRDVARIQGWSVVPKNESYPYGKVKEGAWIKVPVARLRRSTVGTTEHEIRVRRTGSTPLPRFCTPYSKDGKGNRLTADYRT